MTIQDTTSAPVPIGEAGTLSRSTFLSTSSPAIEANISEPARFPSHADEADYLSAASKELCERRVKSIDDALEIVSLRGVIHEALGYIGALRLDIELGRVTPKTVEQALFTLALDLRKAVEA